MIMSIPKRVKGYAIPRDPIIQTVLKRPIYLERVAVKSLGMDSHDILLLLTGLDSPGLDTLASRNGVGDAPAGDIVDDPAILRRMIVAGIRTPRISGRGEQGDHGDDEQFFHDFFFLSLRAVFNA